MRYLFLLLTIGSLNAFGANFPSVFITPTGKPTRVPADGDSALSIMQNNTDYAFVYGSTNGTAPQFWTFGQTDPNTGNFLIGTADSTATKTTEGFSIVPDFGVKIDQGNNNNFEVAGDAKAATFTLDGVTITSWPGSGAAANWTPSGSTNSTLKGIASTWEVVATNGVTSLANSSIGTFTTWTTPDTSSLYAPWVNALHAYPNATLSKSNYVFSSGFNVGPSGIINTNQWTYQWNLETDFEYNTGLTQMEWYNQVGLTNGFSFRPIGGFIRGTNSVTSFASDTVNFFDIGVLNQNPFKIQANPGSIGVTFAGTMQINPDTNSQSSLYLNGGNFSLTDSSNTKGVKFNVYELGHGQIADPLSITNDFDFVNFQNFNIYRSTSPTALHLYNTRTDASNYERLNLAWLSDTLWMYPSAAGSGSPRALSVVSGSGNNLFFGADQTQQWQVKTASDLTPVSNNSANIGSNTERVKSLYVGTSILMGTNILSFNGTNLTWNGTAITVP